MVRRAGFEPAWGTRRILNPVRLPFRHQRKFRFQRMRTAFSPDHPMICERCAPIAARIVRNWKNGSRGWARTGDMQRGRLPPDGTFAKGVSYSNIQRGRLPPYRLGYARRFIMVGPPGLEPGTTRLKAGCSDIRATDPKGGGQRVFAHQPFRSCAATPLDATITRDAMRKNQPAYIWSRERDLNPQLSDYKSGALRLELSRHKWWTGVDSNHRGW